ncbi:hypothetical protein K1719_031949 [Acacia pycnantha]|nr:hypothetical protein K1719_031949 [Acacia pycnantha]
MHVYSEECLLEIGNMVGKALKVDVNTLAQCNNQNMMVERGKFARVSVEVDLNQALKSSFVIRSTIYTVEYEGLDLICFKCGKYGHSQEKCPLVCNAEENSSEITQPIVNTSHASKIPSCYHAQLKPLVSVPGINSDEEFSSWMIAKRNSRKRILIVETEKKDVEDRIYSKGVDRLRKTEVATTTWRRKEGEALSSIKEGVVESREREKSVIGSLKPGKSLIESSESGTKEDVVGHIEKEKLNLDTNGKCSLVIGEPHLESSTVREKKEKVMKVKEKEGKATNALVGQPVILSQSFDGYNLRPNGLSSVRNKKKATRAHNVIFGSTKTIRISKVSEAKEQAEGEERRIMKRRL